MKTHLFTILLFTVMNINAPAQSIHYFYVSSPDPDHAAGIALFGLDAESGAMELIKEFEGIATSSYLALSSNGENLYTITHRRGEAHGEVSSFLILDGGKSLEFLNTRTTMGAGPCYVSLDNSGKYLMIANYSQGNVGTYALEMDGIIGGNISNSFHSGSSVNKSRQEAPHPHMILPAPEGNIVVVPDLGIDRIMIYELTEKGKLKPGLQPYATVKPGAGPRHFAFHPSLKYGYVLNELDASVTGFTFDRETGYMDHINTVAILPDDFDSENKAADIHITPNGEYLYASNRGHNSLAVLKINPETGQLQFLFHEDCGGSWPRAFAIDPTGKFVLAANKRSGNIVSFKIDYSTGHLVKSGEIETFPSPQCIKFIPTNTANDQ